MTESHKSYDDSRKIIPNFKDQQQLFLNKKTHYLNASKCVLSLSNDSKTNKIFLSLETMSLQVDFP